MQNEDRGFTILTTKHNETVIKKEEKERNGFMSVGHIVFNSLSK